MNATSLKLLPLLLAVACLSARAERYVVRVGETQSDIGWKTYWSGVVDTQANTFKLTEFLTDADASWRPGGAESNLPWPAVQPGPNGVPVPYDIPEVWNGKAEDWGFIAPINPLELDPAYRLTPNGPLNTGNKVQPGFGCVREVGSGVDRLVCDSITPRGRSTLQFAAMWPNEGGIYGPDENGESITQLWGQGLAAYGSYTFKRESDPEPRTVGDVNHDDLFTSQDLILVMQEGRYEKGVKGAIWEQGDWNFDLLFDSEDMVLAFQEGNYEQASAVSVVPEPAGATLVLIGFAALIRMQRARRRV